MTVGIDPVILSSGPLAVRWFGLLALVGLGLGIGLSLRALERQKLGRAQALAALAWGLPVGVVTARLVHVLGNWDFYLTSPGELWQLNIDGLSLWGGVIGGTLVAAARLRRDPYRRRRILDAIAPNAALGIAVGRLGMFLDGHGQGLPSQLPWATQYSNPLAATPDFGVPRHPAQLYDALLALLVFGMLSAIPRRAPPGTRLAGFLVVYGACRILLGAVRLDAGFVFGLQIEQLLAVGSVVFGVWFGLRPLLDQLRRPALSAAGQAELARAKEDSMAA